MLKVLFGKKEKWVVTIKNGDMIRRSIHTGAAEYRDTTKKCWIPFSGSSELEKIRTHSSRLMSG